MCCPRRRDLLIHWDKVSTRTLRLSAPVGCSSLREARHRLVLHLYPTGTAFDHPWRSPYYRRNQVLQCRPKPAKRAVSSHRLIVQTHIDRYCSCEEVLAAFTCRHRHLEMRHLIPRRIAIHVRASLGQPSFGAVRDRCPREGHPQTSLLRAHGRNNRRLRESFRNRY